MKPNTTEESRIHSLFFSYGHDEYTDLIGKIKAFFEEQGFHIFIDHEHLRSGIDWEYKLEKAIEKNEKFIFFITKHSVRRPDSYCLNEIALAQYLGKEIIPIMIENSRPPLSIIRTQYLDLTNTKVKNDITTLHQHLNQVIKVLNGKAKLDNDGRQSKLIASLNPIDFRQDFKRHHGIVGREWVKNTLDEWMSQNDSSVLWITADAGYGKSAIAAYLAQYHPRAIGIHFCSNDSPVKNNPINVVKTMAYHFQTQIDGYYDEIKDIDLAKRDLNTLVDDLILTPLENTTKSDEIYIFIIDGIDEAGEYIGGRMTNTISQMIRDKFIALPPNIRIVITSRPEPYLRSHLSHLKPLELSMEEQKNREDCRTFIQLEFFRQMKGENPSNEFIESLLSKSGGNMLYIKSFFDAARNGLASIADPNTFPTGLDGMYHKYFDAYFTSLDQYRLEYKPLFETISIYKDHTEEDLLASILSNTQAELNQKVNLVGSFLKKENGKLHYYHKSLEDWLLNDSSLGYQIDPEKGKKRFDSFLKNLNKQTFAKFSHSRRFNYHLAKYYLSQKEGISIYRDFILLAGNMPDKIQLLLDTASLFLDEQEYDEGRSILLLAKSFAKKEKPIERIDYYMRIVVLWAGESDHLNDQGETKKFLKSIDKLIEKHSSDVSDNIVKRYSDILIVCGNKFNDKKVNELLKKNQKRIENRYKSRPDIVSEYQTSTLTTELSVNSALFGGLGVGAVMAGAGLIPILGQVVALGGVTYGLSKYFRNRKTNETNEVFETSLMTLEKSLKKNPQKWIQEYLQMIEPQLELYLKLGENKKASKLLQSSKKIIEGLYERNPNRWKSIYDKINSLIDRQVGK